MKYKYGFNVQENANCCGQYAVINALLLLGKPISVAEAHRSTKTNRLQAWLNGTGERNIKQSLKYYGCNPKDYSTKSADKLKSKVDYYVERNIPLIASVDNYDHWIVLAGKDDNKYYWLDSANNNVIGHSSWKTIVQWMYADEDPYYFIAVIPEKDAYPLKDIKALERIAKKNPWLFSNYGTTLVDLLDILTADVNKPDSDAEKFLNEHRNEVVLNLEYLYAEADDDDLYELVDDYIALAKLHGLKYPSKNDAEVLTRLAIMLTLYTFGI